MENFFCGIITALVTPFKNGNIDFAALEKLLAQQIKAGIKSVVLAGSTGEGNLMSEQEKEKLVAFASNVTNKRLNIIAGVGHYNPTEAANFANKLQKAGARGLLISPPPYIKPSNKALRSYFKVIHDNTNLPIMLYNIPARTGVNLSNELIIELSKLPRIRGLKDCSGSLMNSLYLSDKLGEDCHLLAGDDESMLAISAHGGLGCVSVAANVIPEICAELDELIAQERYKEALKLKQKLFPFYKVLFSETNPVGIKILASKLGFCEAELRPPLGLENEDFEEKILAAFKALGA